MNEQPDCLNRRYLALDALIEDIGRHDDMRRQQVSPNDSNASVVSEDPGLRLMCHFWNILKEEPECDLTVSLFFEHLMETSVAAPITIQTK